MTASGARLAVIACAACLFAQGAGATTVAADGQLVASCASCHGVVAHDGGIPVIAGQDQDRIVAAMRAYREDASRSQIMHVVAAALSADEIESVARTLAAQR